MINNKIKWKPATEKPKKGEEIWVLMQHWKLHWPSSFNIAGGEVEYANDGSWRVNTCDYDGRGSYCYYPVNGEHTHSFYSEQFFYWCYKEDINVPLENLHYFPNDKRKRSDNDDTNSI